MILFTSILFCRPGKRTKRAAPVLMPQWNIPLTHSCCTAFPFPLGNSERDQIPSFGRQNQTLTLNTGRNAGWWQNRSPRLVLARLVCVSWDQLMNCLCPGLATCSLQGAVCSIGFSKSKHRSWLEILRVWKRTLFSSSALARKCCQSGKRIQFLFKGWLIWW